MYIEIVSITESNFAKQSSDPQCSSSECVLSSFRCYKQAAISEIKLRPDLYVKL